MAVTSRLRSVPPSMFSDELLLELPAEVRLTGIGLRFFANDHGRQTANPTMLKAQLWPLTPHVTEEAIDDHLVALEDAGYIRLYAVGARTYFQLVEWPSVQHRSEDVSRVPAPPPEPSNTGQSTPDSSTQTLPVVEREGERRGERGREGESGERAGRAGGSAEGGRALLVGTPEPSPFCKKHPEGTDWPCPPCGRARLANKQWFTAQMEAAAAEDLREAS